MANLSSETSPFPERIFTKVIYRNDTGSDCEMAPWSVIWSLEA
jgi:hypothetical protein